MIDMNKKINSFGTFERSVKILAGNLDLQSISEEDIRMFHKEKAEHPSFTDAQIFQIIQDHKRNGVRG